MRMERCLCDCRADTCSEGNGVDSRLLVRGMLVHGYTVCCSVGSTCYCMRIMNCEISIASIK